MQTRQAGGQEGRREETSRLGLVSQCPRHVRGQRGGREPQGLRAGPSSAIVGPQEPRSCPSCSRWSCCHIPGGAQRAASTLAGSFAWIFCPQLGLETPPGRLGDLGDPNHNSQSSPNTPGIPCPPKPCASPKLRVPPGSWHGACAIHSIPSPLAALCVFGVYIPGSLDTADHTHGAARHRLTSSSRCRFHGQEAAWLLQFLLCQTVHVNPEMARTRHRVWEGKYPTERLQMEGWGWKAGKSP